MCSITNIVFPMKLFVGEVRGYTLGSQLCQVLGISKMVSPFDG
jgi:hypothetical protein